EGLAVGPPQAGDVDEPLATVADGDRVALDGGRRAGEAVERLLRPRRGQGEGQGEEGCRDGLAGCPRHRQGVLPYRAPRRETAGHVHIAWKSVISGSIPTGPPRTWLRPSSSR